MKKKKRKKGKERREKRMVGREGKRGKGEGMGWGRVERGEEGGEKRKGVEKG
ncbi:hypothetical protein [Escherichia coli]|uniref:hypothetical protein n=1 Tax=Escherichia coli TaxID=562 RepID=UPI001649AA90|nr:hypothetical protein [Escherichia coli]